MLQPECIKGRTNVNTVAKGNHPSSALHMAKNVGGVESKTTLR